MSSPQLHGKEWTQDTLFWGLIRHKILITKKKKKKNKQTKEWAQIARHTIKAE